jgi:hypothetical protein
VVADTVIKRAAISEPHALAKALMGKWSEHFREKTEVTLEAPLAGPHARVLGRWEGLDSAEVRTEGST